MRTKFVRFNAAWTLTLIVLLIGGCGSRGQSSNSPEVKILDFHATVSSASEVSFDGSISNISENDLTNIGYYISHNLNGQQALAFGETGINLITGQTYSAVHYGVFSSQPYPAGQYTAILYVKRSDESLLVSKEIQFSIM